MLGPSGSGKTVYLASLFKRLSVQGQFGFHLGVDGNKRKILNNYYTTIALSDDWLEGTKYNEVSDWEFTCRVRTKDLSDYAACKFTYLDYSGSRLTDVIEGEEDSSLEERFENSDTLLGLIDGFKLMAFMRNERMGRSWVLKDLSSMIDVMQKSNKPIHFVISKWDIVEDNFSLKEICDRLLEDEAFYNIVKQRNDAGSIVRLIPVSSVGKGFAKLEPDGSMKKTGALPKPFQVEVPLACVLPDMIKVSLEDLIKKREAEEKRTVDVSAKIGIFGRLGQVFGGSLRLASKLLPKRYQFAEDVLKNLIEAAEKPAYEKQKEAKIKSQELRQQKEELLKEVKSEETALNYGIQCFISIANDLDIQFPESKIMLP